MENIDKQNNGLALFAQILDVCPTTDGPSNLLNPLSLLSL